MVELQGMELLRYLAVAEQHDKTLKPNPRREPRSGPAILHTPNEDVPCGGGFRRVLVVDRAE